MEIFNIVNKDIATIQNCANEPIHIPGAIHPFGALLAIDANGSIKYCSSNTELLLGWYPVQVLGKNLEDILPTVNDQLALLKPAQNGVQHNGVGLAICKRIVEQHGGTITANGQKGVGAVFQIFLPAAE